MFERYTERSRRVIFFARYEALQYGSPVIASEHILLGLMREDKTIAPRYFPGRRGITVDSLRKEVEERIVLRDRIPQSAELHLAPETKRILFYASEESRHLKSRHIGPEHLLLGMAREENSVAAEILMRLGIRTGRAGRDIPSARAAAGTCGVNARRVTDAKSAGIYS